MLDRNGLESAAGAISLGKLADDSVIALIHYLTGRRLTAYDQAALERSRRLLHTVAELSGRRLARTDVFRAMAPIGALDEAVEVVTNAKLPTEELATSLRKAIDLLDSVLEGKADDDGASHLRGLFERLAEITLVKSEELTKPHRQQRHEWIRKALTS